MAFASSSLMAVILLSFLFGLVGVVWLFSRAIRFFRVGEFWPGFLSLVCAILLSGIVLGLVIPDHGCYAGEKAKRAMCMSNLKQFVLFLKYYANDHDGKSPVTFNDVVGDCLKDSDLRVFICPSSGHKAGGLTNIHEWTDYAYVSGLIETDPSYSVVMFCPPADHRGDGANVAFLNGEVQWFNCKPDGKSPPEHQPTFQELTNNPALFYGTTNEAQLAELRQRTMIIYPHGGMRQ